MQGLTLEFLKSCITAASFGAVGGIFALQFFSEVPKVRTEIMQVRRFGIEWIRGAEG